MTKDGTIENYEINPIIEADDPDVLKAPLVAGTGLMMISDTMVRGPAAEGLVRPVLPGWIGDPHELYAVFPYGHVQPPRLRAFIDFLVPRLQTESAAPQKTPLEN